MHCRQLTDIEIIDVYSTQGPQHFPQDELKPVWKVKQYLEQNTYLGFGFYDEEQLVGYALFYCTPEFPHLLLDYYAVLTPYRKKGIGSAFLQDLRQTVNAYGFYIESENPISDAIQTKKEKETRLKRISFYHRNGALDTTIQSTVYGVDYQVLYMPVLSKTMAGAALAAAQAHLTNVEHIYKSMFPSPIYEQFTHIERAPIPVE